MPTQKFTKALQYNIYRVKKEFSDINKRKINYEKAF